MFSLFADSIINFPSPSGPAKTTMLGNKPIYGLDSHLKPTCQAAAHPLSTLQSLGNISNQPALQPQEPAT